MRLIRTRFRRRRGAPDNNHLFGMRAAFRTATDRTEHEAVKQGFKDAAQIAKNRIPNLPGETNRQFAQRMRAQ